MKAFCYITIIFSSFIFTACVGSKPTEIDKPPVTSTNIPTQPSEARISITPTFIPTFTPQINSIIKFKGAVSRGQIFEKEISNDLVFRLDQSGQDWGIWIGDKSETNHDFSALATPPFHGMNSSYIEGWHFRNSDNSGPNEAGEKNVNAPQHERRFCFFLNEADYQIAYYYRNDQLLSSDEERHEIQEKFRSLEAKAGTLNITHLELGNLLINERAWIEHMKFEVELKLEDKCNMF